MDLARLKLKELVRQHGTQARAAAALGVSPQYLSDLLNGRRGYSAGVLEKLGLKKVVLQK